MFLGIERRGGETGHVGVHAPLTVQGIDELGASATVFPAQQPFEQRLAAVVDADVDELLVGHSGILLALLHHGGQLLVVAYEYEAVDVVGGQQADERRFEYLRSLVDDAEREVLQLQNLLARLHGRGGGHDDARLLNILLHLAQFADVAERGFEQATAEQRVARGFAAYAQVVDVGRFEHGAYLVDGPVGVAHQQEL